MKTTRHIVVAALMATILVVSKYALDALPNIELITLLIIIYALELPKLALPGIFGYLLIYGLFNGFGIWWFPQLYIWPLLLLVVRAFNKVDNAVFWAVIGSFFGLFYGALYGLSYLLTVGFYGAVTWWVAGIPFDLLHCVGNFTVILVLYKPLRKVMQKCKLAINLT